MNEGSVNRNPQNLHKFAYSQFGFRYWSLSLAGYTARLPLHLSHPHEPHCVEGIIGVAASKDSILRLWKGKVSKFLLNLQYYEYPRTILIYNSFSLPIQLCQSPKLYLYKVSIMRKQQVDSFVLY
ncbi:uncharacterized protein LOC115989768 isoform X2 [Quercus lobata]|uniref:uncharacterized protein LOC115989768 isoform X2 n=1 Tax=Quercus lobata TaxID=97700 RepID=UPI001246D880|nr:uncharacterized protein LOC115989768 isoform X2 [Quercus lobata]